VGIEHRITPAGDLDDRRAAAAERLIVRALDAMVDREKKGQDTSRLRRFVAQLQAQIGELRAE
jgi:hypothetical protein